MKPVCVSALLLFLAVTVGCGGGNSTSSTTAPNAKALSTAAQGLYTGTITDGTVVNQLEVLLLPSGTFYAIVSETQDCGGTSCVFPMRYLTGQGVSSSGNYTVSSVSEVATSLASGSEQGMTYSGGVSATYDSSNVQGTFSEIGTSLNSSGTGYLTTTTKFSFKGTVSPLSNYDFSTPASANSLIGVWRANPSFSGFGESITGLVIASNGTFTGHMYEQLTSRDSTSCDFTGTVTPSATNNFYDVSVPPGLCLPYGTTSTGIGVVTVDNSGNRHLLVMISVNLGHGMLVLTATP